MMNNTTTIYGIFDDEEILLSSVKEIRSNDINIKEVYSPFPIHGIDPVIGIKRTRLAITSFMYAMTGLTLIVSFMWYTMISDWPMNIGGKPSFSLIENLPAFIPVTFEFSVLCAAHGMVITYLLRNGTLPGMPATNPDPRTTDNMFVMEITTDSNSMNAEELETAIKNTGLFELSIKESK